MTLGRRRGRRLGAAAGGGGGVSLLFTETPTTFLSVDTAVQPFIGTASYPGGIHVAALDKSFLTWEHVTVTERSVARVQSFDHTAETPEEAWSTIYDAGAWNFPDDAHGQPVIEHGPDGHFYEFFNAHNIDIEWAISAIANDISVWNQQSAIAGSYAYCKPITVGDDMHLLARSFVGGSPAKYTLVHRSGTPSSGTLSFGAETTLIDLGSDSRCYVSEVHRVGTEIWFVATRANAADTERKHVYGFKFETTTGDVKNFAGTTTIANADLPVDLTEANADFRLVDSGSNRTFQSSFQIDSNGNPHILYGDGTGTSIPAKHIWHNGTSWQAAADVATIQDGDSNTGFVDVCTLVPAASGAMEAIYPQDPGSDWSVRGGDMTRKLWTPGGGWGTAEALDPAGIYARAHPFAFRNGHANMRAAWCEVRQAAEYSSPVALELTVHGDSGFALPADPPVFQYGVGDNRFQLQVDDAGIINDVTWRYNDAFVITGATVNGTEIVFDGNDRINWPDSGAWTPGGDFTVRFNGIKWSSLTETVQCLMGHQDGNNTGEVTIAWRIYWNSTNGITFGANFGAGFDLRLTHAFTPTLNQAYDVVFERNGNTLFLYIDDLTAGNHVASAAMASAPINVAQPLVVGAEYNSNIGGNYRRFFSGRMTKVTMTWAAEISG